jgi:hypothetical protein
LTIDRTRPARAEGYWDVGKAEAIRVNASVAAFVPSAVPGLTATSAEIRLELPPEAAPAIVPPVAAR